jgi:hypothetical protein
MAQANWPTHTKETDMHPHDFWTIKAFKQDHYHDGLCRVIRRQGKLWGIVDKFALNLKREEHYDFPLFDVAGTGHDVAAFLLGCGGMWVGACALKTHGVFRPDGTQLPPLLQWVWIHPYFRRQGLFTKAWADLEKTHGELVGLGPLSSAMSSFTLKYGVDPDRIVVCR